MEDVASLLREGGERSLVFVDELGSRTSPRDGVRLVGAMLEAMALGEWGRVCDASTSRFGSTVL